MNMLHHLVRSTADILSITAGGLVGGKIGAAFAPLVIEDIALRIAGQTQSQSQAQNSPQVAVLARTYIATNFIDWYVEN